MDTLKTRDPKPNISFILMVTVTLVINNGVLSYAASPQYTNEAYHHNHVFERNYELEWQVDWNTKSIIFNVSAECKGYIGMGLSKTGEIAGSDFVIGGIDSTGNSYFSDMHGIANGSLQEDSRSDWKFLWAHRGKGRIYLSFSRPFETCDEEDYTISGDLVHVIWAYGDTDEVSLFSPHHGHEAFYLLDPDITTEVSHGIYRQIGPHSNLYLMQRWRPITTRKMPAITDSQMCSIIKGPQMSSKHYIYGGGAYLPFEESQNHIRQIILNRCASPEGADTASFFDPLIKKEGQECNSSLTPKHLCTETVFVWSFGGKPFYFPEEFGIPIDISTNEYYMLEVHYYNPENLKDVSVKAGLELMFHPGPRTFEAGIQMISHGRQGLFPIPSRSSSFNIDGHCSSECTKAMFPEEGIDVIAVLFQMRGLGKTVRLRHFRGTVELPWILNDDNYESNRQQMRLLQKFVTVLPGDQMTLQCSYDALGISNSTFSGLDDKEACAAYLVLSRRVSSAWCSSENSVTSRTQNLRTPPSTGNKRRASATSASSEKLFAMAGKNGRWTSSARASSQTDGLQTSSCPSRTQVAKTVSSRLRRLPIIASRSRRGQNDTATSTTSSFTEPIVTSSVTIPNNSSDYSPPKDCPRNNASGNHGNTKVRR